MNRDRFYGIWMQLSGKIKEKWGIFANNPFIASVGTRQRIAGRLQEQRGISKQEADLQLEAFMSRNRNWQDLSRY